MMRLDAKLPLLAVLPLFSTVAMADSMSNSAFQPVGPCAGQVSYQSATDNAYKFLEKEQNEIYTANRGLADPFLREELNNPKGIKTIADLKRRAEESCPDPLKRDTCAMDPALIDVLFRNIDCLTLPTRYESPLFYGLIKLYTDELDKVRIGRYPESSAARFGSLPTGTVDAQAVFPDGADVPLVILNRDIFFFTGALSKSISDAIPILKGESVSLVYSEEGIRKRLHSNPYIVSNFADAVARMVRKGSSRGAMEVTLDDDHNHLHARLVGAMDKFIIAHEQAHVILKHVSKDTSALHLAGAAPPRGAHETVEAGRRPIESLRGDSRARAAGEVDSDGLKAQVRTREQELEADALGFRLSMWSEENSKDPVGQLVATAAPHMVFRIMDSLNVYSREAGGWYFGDANHPSAADRVKALSSVYDEFVAKSPLLRQVDFRPAFDSALKVLLEEADGKIRQNLDLKPRPQAASR